MNITRETRDRIRDMLRLGMPKDEISTYYAVSLRTVERIDHDRRKAELRKLTMHQTINGKLCKVHRCLLPCRACRAETAVEVKLANKRAQLQGVR